LARVANKGRSGPGFWTKANRPGGRLGRKGKLLAAGA